MKITKNMVSLGEIQGNPNDIWDVMAEFAKYCFNKAHAVAYSIISYANAVLWTHHRNEYLEYLINYGPARQKDKALKKCKDMGYKFEYPGICSEHISDKYRVEGRTVYMPNENNYNFKNYSDFIMSDMDSLEKNKLILKGGTDKFTLDRKGLTELIKAIPKTEFGKEFFGCDDILTFLEYGQKIGLWNYTDNTEFYHVEFPLSLRARKQKVVDIYKNRYLPAERLEFNIKHDIKNYGSSKGNQLSSLPELDENILLGKTIRVSDQLIERCGGNLDIIREDRLLMSDLRRQLENVYRDGLKDPKIARMMDWENEEFTALFLSMKVSKGIYQNGNPWKTGKVSLSFENETNATFWVRSESLINKFQPLTKKSIVRLRLKPEMYIDKNLKPVLLIKIADVITETTEEEQEIIQEQFIEKQASRSSEIRKQEADKQAIIDAFLNGGE